MKDEGHLPGCPTGSATCPAPTPSRSSARSRPTSDPIDYTLRRRDHLVVPPRRRHPHRAGALRQGLQHDGACCRRCSPTATAPGRAGGPGSRRCGRSARNVRDLYDFKHWSERTVIALVMQTLDNSITTYGKQAPAPAWRMTSQAGPRRAEPDLDPGRQRGRTPDGRDHGRHRRRLHRRAVQHAADRPLHRRLRDRRLAGDRRRSTPTSGSTATRACTSSTARRSPPTSGVNPSLTITAQAERAMSFWPNKGEADPRPGARAAYERMRRSPRTPRSSPTSAPARCGCRSSASAEPQLTSVGAGQTRDGYRWSRPGHFRTGIASTGVTRLPGLVEPAEPVDMLPP